MGASFIDRLGDTMLIPFFALYITRKFDVGMTEAGILLGLYALAGAVGNILGGGLTDRLGRKTMLLAGLLLSAGTTLTMGFVNSYAVFFPLAVLVGLVSFISQPARQAMVADLVPEAQRAEAFGIFRVVMNLSWVLGPSIGGLLAGQSYVYVFVVDAITSALTAALVFVRLPETGPDRSASGEGAETVVQTFAGYRVVTANRLFMAFLLVSMLLQVIYNQLYNTLSVYLRDLHGLPAQGYGLLMSINAGTVVLFQFWVTRRVRDRPPMLMMAVGAALYMVGFTMYGFVTTFVFFTAAMVIITVGEMVVLPVSQAFVANLAPDDMRGRYMAVFGISWVIPASIAPGLAGLILDNYNPNWVWYGGGVIAALSVAGFVGIHLATRSRWEAASRLDAPELAITEVDP
ncbi:MAG: MFS transporter [Chloroflexota bacterium]